MSNFIICQFWAVVCFVLTNILRLSFPPVFMVASFFKLRMKSPLLVKVNICHTLSCKTSSFFLYELTCHNFSAFTAQAGNFTDLWKDSFKSFSALCQTTKMIQLAFCFIRRTLGNSVPCLQYNEATTQKSRSPCRLNLTLFENYSKCRIWILAFWHFPPIFVQLKLTCLVTLFDRKLQVFKNSPKWTIFAILN